MNTPDVMCFGVLSYLQLVRVEKIADRNNGTVIKQKFDSFGDDAAIVAAILHQWGVSTRLVPSTLGRDEYGRKAAVAIEQLGLDAELAFDSGIDTVFEISIADRTGDRTYYYQRSPEAVATLGHADISNLRTARFLYADWYDGDHILRPIEVANISEVSIFINIESQFDNRELLKHLGPTSVCQVALDDSRSEEDMAAAAHRVLERGVGTVLVTAGARGCLAADETRMIRVRAPRLKIADGNGAGSCFAAGYIYGRLQGWPLERCARFATAHASLKCSRVGYTPYPLAGGERLAGTLEVVSRSW